MIRTLITAGLLAWWLPALWGQTVCTPDTTVTGIEPDTLPAATVGQPYDEVIYFKIPTSRDVFGNVIPIDSALIDTLKGFPPSFSYQCNQPECLYLGGEAGCIRITGTPTRADTGLHYIKVFAVIYTVINGAHATLPQLDSLPFIVEDTALVTAIAPIHDGRARFRIGPTPMTDVLVVEGEGLTAGRASIHIYSLLGHEMARQDVMVAPSGKLLWKWRRPAGVPAGLYFLRIRAGHSQVIHRFHIAQR